MDGKLLDKLKKQTVKICDESDGKKLLGTGFLVNKETVFTAEHCLYQDHNDPLHRVRLYLGDRSYDGTVQNCTAGIALIKMSPPYAQACEIRLGYCEKLDYGSAVDFYGFPQNAPEGYELCINIGNKICRDQCRRTPFIRCNTSNLVGALEDYTALSGAPVVFQNHIIGMIVMEDTGNHGAYALYIQDFSDYLDEIRKAGIPMERVILESRPDKYKAGAGSLYVKGWWMRKKRDSKGGRLMISDQYSVILATLLLGMRGSADIVLASPWAYGLAEYLQKETDRYEGEIHGWRGRCWTEYRNNTSPNWRMMDNFSGIVISLKAEDCNEVLLSSLLVGRRNARKDMIVLWNIWSSKPEEAVLQAVNTAEKIHYCNERKDVLTVFPSWKSEKENGQIFLVHETACKWLEMQSWKETEWDRILLRLNTEEIDALTWEIFQYAQKYKMDEAEEIFERLWVMCSDSIRILISLWGNRNDLASLTEVEPSAIKRWFALMQEKECDQILSVLKKMKNQSLYWSAILSNPYCTRVVLQERCSGDKVLAGLVLDQNADFSSDIVLNEEAGNIRCQIRPE